MPPDRCSENSRPVRPGSRPGGRSRAAAGRKGGPAGLTIPLVRLWNGAPAPAGCGGRVGLRQSRGRLRLEWELALAGPPRIPPGPAGFTPGLWEWDVVELFLAPGRSEGAAAAYLEFESGPAGHWLALAFGSVRGPAAELRALAPRIEATVAGTSWRGRAEWPAAAVAERLGPGPYRGLVAAVLGAGPGNGPERLHFAWPALPGARPDFHQPASWSDLGGDPSGSGLSRGVD